MVINDNVRSYNQTNLCSLILKQPLMSIINQIDPPWQTANIFVLLNAFETFCFPLCITGIVFFLYNALNRIVLNQITSHR